MRAKAARMTAAASALRARSSHLYPGARLTGAVGPGPVHLEFADGIAIGASLAPDNVLSAPAYVTARGAAIPAKRWRLARAGDGWRVAERLPD
jgi:hypothetical protein